MLISAESSAQKHCTIRRKVPKLRLAVMKAIQAGMKIKTEVKWILLIVNSATFKHKERFVNLAAI